MNIRDINLNLLMVFHTIYEARSISAAASQLDLSQPGMSHALKRLREQFGDKLFLRKGNGVEPTVYADSIAEPIRNAIALLQTGLNPDPPFDPATSKRHFRLLLADFVEQLIMPGLLQATFANRDLSFELIAPQSVVTEDAILEGSVDLVAHLQTDMMQEISVEPLFPINVVLAYRKGHPLEQSDAAPGGLSLFGAALSYRRISPNLRAGAVKNFDKAKVDQNVDRQSGCLVHSIRSIPALLSETDYVASLPWLYAAEVAERYGLVIRPLPVTMIKQDITLSWHRRNDGDLAIAWLRKAIAEIIADKTARAQRLQGAG